MPQLPELKDSALTLEGGVATLTFKRDDVRNALTSSELVAEIPRVIAWATATREVSVLILTGEGSAFSAGGNIKTMGQRAKGPAFELQQAYRRGIPGDPARARGVRRAGDRGRERAGDRGGLRHGEHVRHPHRLDRRAVRRDLRQPRHHSRRRRRLVPAAHRRLSARGRAGTHRPHRESRRGESARHPARSGRTGELLPRAQEIAAKIASKPPLAVRYGKRLLKLAQRQQLAEHLDVCSAFQAICHKTEDHQEALTAFFEKRPGKFTGK